MAETFSFIERKVHREFEGLQTCDLFRFLIFSPSPVKNARVSIDGIPLQGVEHVQGPLWVCRCIFKFVVKKICKIVVLQSYCVKKT